MRGLLLSLVAAAAIVSAVPSRVSAAAAPHGAVVSTSVYALQQNPVKDVNVDINVNHSGARWYRNPVWIAIGVLAVIVILLLLVLAMRGGGSGTTIIRE